VDALFRKLEHATFSQREQIAAEAARELTADDLERLGAALAHPHAPVRLGVIEILRRAGHRASVQRLLAHAQAHDGDDRVFAIRALAQLAESGDEALREPARAWLRANDEFVVAQATLLARALGMRAGAPASPAAARAAAAPAAPSHAAPPRPAPAPTAPAASANDPAGREPLEALVAQLLAARGDAARRALVAAIEARGPQALAGAARVVVPKGNADAIAFVCRALIRHATALPSPERLVTLLEAARVRLAEAPIASAAIDDAVLALGGQRLSAALLARIGEMDRAQLDGVVARLRDLPASDVALHVPALLDALARNVALWSAFGAILAYAAPHVRDGARGQLRELVEVALGELRHGKPLDPVSLVSVCYVLARIAEPGEPLSRHLRVALERLAVAEASRALVALCARLATEEAARVLVAMLRDPLAEARAAAREALSAWQSPWIALEHVDTDAPVLVPRYADERGEPLARRGERLVVATSGEEYVLDPRGRPVRGGETEYGGCLCCAPPRALVRRRREGLRCPTTHEAHLRDGSKVTVERDHALGRCTKCDSIRPRIRDGGRVICLDCGAGAPPDVIVVPAPGQPAVPSEGTNQDAFPKPPTAAELEHIAPHIRAAIMANMFLHGRDGDDRWNGSGIVIAREGNHVAILTNRHVVESDDRRPCALTAMSVTGETIPASAVWRANRGVDLALVEVRLDKLDGVGVMPLGAGGVLVGAPVFAIGNPLGLAWSYTGGTLSATRHWTTQDGQSVRILQTDAAIAPGSSGGGLFHGDGHLIGVMSFLRQGHAGGSAHFALSIDAIRDAFAREDVRWRGHALAELPR